MELEEKVNQLQQEFSLPKVLIKKTLCGDDINGDIVKAKQRLQEFKQINNRSHPFLKGPIVCTNPLTGMLEGSLHDSPEKVSDSKTGNQFKEQNQNVGVSSDTSIPPQTTQKKRAPDSSQPKSKANVHADKLEEVLDAAKIRKQKAEIAKTPKRNAQDKPKPKPKPNWREPVSGDTSFPPQKIAGVNPIPGNHSNNTNPGPSMKDTAFKRKTSFGILDFTKNNDQKLEGVSDSSAMRTQNTEMDTTQKKRSPDFPQPKSKANVHVDKLEEVLDAAKIRKQKAEIAKTPKRNAQDKPKPKPKPNWKREPAHGAVNEQNKEERNGEDKQQFNDIKAAETSSVAEMNLKHFEEKVKKLQEEFSSMPKVLLKKTLWEDDVNGDLVKARQRLQNSKQIDNPFLKRTSPVANEPATENPKEGKQDSLLHQWKPRNNDSVSGDTSFLPQTTAGLNPIPGNEGSIKNLGPSMKDTALGREKSFEISDFINNNDQKLGGVSDIATIRTQNIEIDTTQKKRVPGSAQHKFKANANANKLEEVLDAKKKIRKHKAEIAKTPKRNAQDKPKTKHKQTWRKEPVSGDTSFLPQTTAGLNPTPGNQNNIKNIGPSMKDTAFASGTSSEISDFINNNDQKLEKEAHLATMGTQNIQIDTDEKKWALNSPRPKSEPNVHDDKLGEVLDAAKIRTQNTAICKTPKRNVHDPPKSEPNPNWKGEPVHGAVYEQNKEERNGEDKQQFNDIKAAKASSVAKMNIQDFEENVKKLQEEFSSMPKVLLKKTLWEDDVNGDLVKARQRLQESKRIDNPFLKRTTPMANEPASEKQKKGKQDSLLRQWKPRNNRPVSGDTSFPPQTTACLNSTPVNQESIKNLGLSMKETAFKSGTSLEISDFINNNDQKLGDVSDSATTRTQNIEIDTTQKKRAPVFPEPKSEPKVNADKLGAASQVAKIRTQNAEIAKTPNRNAQVSGDTSFPPQTTAGLNPTAGNQSKIKSAGPLMKDTAFESEKSSEKSDLINNDDQKLGDVSATMRTQNIEIDTTQQKRAPVFPEPKSEPNVNADKLGEASQVAKIRPQNAEIAKTPKRNAQVHGAVYEQNKEERNGEDKQQFNDIKAAKASSVARMNIQDFEENVKKLQEEFSSMPKVLLKKTLWEDDVNGDLVKARQRLQESKRIDNPFLKRTTPMANEPASEKQKKGKQDSLLRQWKPRNNRPVSGDTSFPPETTAGLNRTPVNQESIKTFGSSMNDTAFEKGTSSEILDFFNNNDQKLGQVLDLATMRTQNTAIDTTQQKRAPDFPTPKSEPNVHADKLGEASQVAKIRTQNAEIAKTLKRNVQVPPKSEPNPNWKREPVSGDTSFPPQTTAGLNPTAGNQSNIKSAGPLMKDTAFESEKSSEKSDLINNDDQKLGDVSATMRTQNIEKRAPVFPEPKSEPNVNADKLREASQVAKIRTQDAEIAKTPKRNSQVSGDTSFPPQATAGLNPTPGNQHSIKNIGPSMKDTAFASGTYSEISDFINNNDQKLEKEAHLATMGTQNIQIDTGEKKWALNSPRPKSEPNVHDDKLGEVLDAAKIRTQNTEICKPPKRNVHDPPKSEPNPNWRREPVSGDTSLPPQTTACLNPTPGNQHSIKNIGPSLKDTAFESETSSEISDLINNDDQKLGNVSDSATTRTQNIEIDTTQKKRAPVFPEPKSEPNVNADKLGEASQVAKIRTQNVEIAKTPKRNSQVSGDTSFPPQTTAGLNPTPGNQHSIKNIGPSMKDTAFERETSSEFSDFINNNDQKLGDVSDSATMRTQNIEIDITQQKMAPVFPEPKSEPNVNADKLGEASQVEIAKTPKRNCQVRSEVFKQKMTESYGEDKEEFNEIKVSKSPSVAEINILDFEERVNKLHEKFSFMPEILYLLKKTPWEYCVNGDLVESRQRLQESRESDNPFLERTSPMENEPATENPIKTRKDSSLHQCKPEDNSPVSGDTPFPPQITAGVNSAVANQCNIKNIGPSMKDTAFERGKRETSSEILDCVNTNDQKLGEVSDSATVRTQNTEIDTTQKKSAADSPKPKSKQNVINSNAQKLGEVLDAAKISTQNAEIAKTPNGNVQDPPKSEPNPNWRREPEHSWPINWETMPRDERGNNVTVHLVDLENACSAYQDVEKRFRQTVPRHNACIVSIKRIQNPFLYQAYQLRKQQMNKDNGGNNERLLFHGTLSGNITKINTEGFDRGFSRSANGATYGNGVYFARDASNSTYYTTTDVGDVGVMYLARVLVGEYCEGSGNMKKPPPKNPQQPQILFDSLVDNMNDPSVFVVYYDNQCYPEYLITFLVSNETQLRSTARQAKKHAC